MASVHPDRPEGEDLSKLENLVGTRTSPSPIVVLGMHRGGTSAVTELLTKMGGWVGDADILMPPDEHNRHGYFERRATAEQLDALLAELGGSWLAPPRVGTGSATMERMRPRLMRLVRDVVAETPDGLVPVIKDPRLTLFSELLPGLLPRGEQMVLCVRHPVEVARSLSYTHGLPLRVGLALWETYLATACQGLAGIPTTILGFDDLIDSPDVAQQRLRRVLSIAGGVGVDAPTESSSVEPALRRHKATSADERAWLSTAQMELWTYLKGATSDHPASLHEVSVSAGAQDELDRYAESGRKDQAIHDLTAASLTQASAALTAVSEERDTLRTTEAELRRDKDQLRAELEQVLAVVDKGSRRISELEHGQAALLQSAVEEVTQLRGDVAVSRETVAALLRSDDRRRVLEATDAQPALEQQLNAACAAAAAAEQAAAAAKQVAVEHVELLGELGRALHLTTPTKESVTSAVEAICADIAFKQYQLEAIASSRSWRLGRLLTSPTRLARRSAGVEGQASDLLPPLPARGELEAAHAFHDAPGTEPPVETDQPSQTAVDVPLASSTEPPATPPPAIDPRFQQFDEAAYLERYPDVLRAVESGAIPSGLHHFIYSGLAEGRPASGYAPYARRGATAAGMLARDEGLTVVGPASAASGLGTTVRGFSAAAQLMNVPSTTVDVDPYSDAPESPRPTGRLSETRQTLLVLNADIFPRFFARHPVEDLSDTYVTAVWVTELLGFRAEWTPSFGAVDEVWAPSRFCQEAISSVSPVPVNLIPYVVGSDLPNHVQDLSARFGISPDRYTFLYAFDASSYLQRKNPMAALAAFRSAFGQRTDVHLLLKSHKMQGAKPAEMEALERAVDEADNVTLLQRRLTNAESWSLKQACDAFVSPHRSEGFGLNVAEAMLLGKTVLATDFSGTTDFLDRETGFPIGYRLTTVGRDLGPYPAGGVWADVDHDQLVDTMRYVVENPAESRRRGQAARARIEGRYSTLAVSEQMRLRFDAIGTSNPEAAAGRVGHSRQTCVTDVDRPPTSTARYVFSDLPRRPLISVLVPVYNVAGPLLQACIDSVLEQSYTNWELCLCDDASTSKDTIEVLHKAIGKDPRIRLTRLSENGGISAATNRALAMSLGEYVALLDNDDTLHPDALLRVTEELVNDPTVDLLYTDEDKLYPGGEYRDDYHKPDWSPELLETTMYLLHMMVVRKQLLLDVGGFRSEFDGAQDYDLALRLSRAARRIHHLPEILYHWRVIPGSAAEVVDAKPQALLNARAALSDHVAVKFGDQAKVADGLLPGLFRVTRNSHKSDPATILIPTNNGSVDIPGRGSVNLVDNLVTSIEENTDYPDWRLVIIDNGNLTPVQQRRLEAAGHRVVSYSGPQNPFNFAQKANFAFSLAETDLLVLLNDDMEVLCSDWLGALMDHAVNPEVGVVGAKLIDLNDRIQHAGIIGGVNGSTAHVFHGAPADHIGYNGFTHTTRNYSMVTGACLATRTDVVSKLGGFDTSLPIDFNDVDFCLRARQLGLRIVYTPHSRLRHFESSTIQRDVANPDEVDLFRHRWESSRFLVDDPYYNRNLSRFGVEFRRARPLDQAVGASDHGH